MSEKILSEFMEALQHCDTVKVVLTGVGESQFKTKDIYLGISKLEEENAKLPDLRREIAELNAINKDMYEALDHLCIAAQKVCDDFCCGAGCSQDARDCKLEGGLIRAEIALCKARGESE